MKKLGIILIAVGLALFFYVIFNVLQDKNKVLSPVPENKGVRVIFISPTK